MPRPAKRASRKESVQSKLKRLEKLARATSRLSLEVFRDIITGYSVPVPPKPKKKAGRTMMMSSVPVPPKPKFEALADIAYGAGVIEDSATALADE
jgi:hypothetical protein